jgi:hypothetical protein
VPLFDTILSELSSSSSSEDDSGSGNTSWSSLLGANWRTLIDSDSNSTTSGSSDLLVDAELNSLPDLGSISGVTGMDDEICEESSSESDAFVGLAILSHDAHRMKSQTCSTSESRSILILLYLTVCR